MKTTDACFDRFPADFSADPNTAFIKPRKISEHNSDFQTVSTVKDFVRVVVPAMKEGRKIACVECGAIFEEDDLAFAHETGICQYCHIPIKALWIR